MIEHRESDFSHIKSPASRFKTSVSSVKGARNAENQDSYLTLPKQGIFAVCDGMGGHVGGQIASQLIVRTLHNTLETGSFEGLNNPKTLQDLTIDHLTYLIGYSNRVVYQHALENLELRGMGSTLVLAWISKDLLHLCHVGDSRAYRLRDYRLTCLTQDHSSSNGKGISRALGVKSTVDVEYHCWDWQPDDCLLLVSDGINDVIQDVRLTNLLVETSGPMVIKISRLMSVATTAGGDDDKTAMLIQSRVPPINHPSPIL